jgi:hypothetical protein
MDIGGDMTRVLVFGFWFPFFSEFRTSIPPSLSPFTHADIVLIMSFLVFPLLS